MRGTRRRNCASNDKRPRRDSSTPSTTALKMADRLVASAGPMCCSGTMNSTFSARFSPIATNPTRTGVLVSPWAKNAGTSTLSTTNAGNPIA